MSRTAATIRQADVARVARVARDLGPDWKVIIFGGRIELVQGGNIKQTFSEKITSKLIVEDEKIVFLTFFSNKPRISVVFSFLNHEGKTMQVTHSADHITHALIGGGKTIDFEMANSAALMQVFSSTLYSNQPLAVAREVLCNAWDAHIRAGITDKPIQVTITDTKICVLDQAQGIAPNKMGPLYGTYGGTDKVNNGLETGGFGFGCKAPFAYNDHFEVISSHLGTRTIYNISRASGGKYGKAGITPIAAFPTEKSGLQVTIPLKTLIDRHLFKILFDRIARNGEMNVEINGNKVQTLPLSESESNWLITNEELGDKHSHPVYIRYGNVIYPVGTHNDYCHEYQSVLKFLTQLNGYNTQYNIVFQAKPNTISVTPSRESLSMQEHTIETVKGLLSGFNNEKLDEKIVKESEVLLDRQIRKAIELRQIGDLMRDDKILPGLKQGSVDLKIIHNSALLAAQFTRQTYPRSDAFYRRDMGLRIDAAIELGIGHRGHLNQVKHQILAIPKKLPHSIYIESQREATKSKEWFKKRILRPLYRDMLAEQVDNTKTPLMDIKRLFITAKHTREHLHNPIYGGNHRDFGLLLPLLRKVVVISFSKKDIWNKICSNTELQCYGNLTDIWFYHAPVSKTKIQAIRDFFTSRGFILVDFTSEENWSRYKTPSTYVPMTTRIAKQKLSGLPALSGVYKADKLFRVDNCFEDGQSRVNNPTFFLQILPSKAESREFILGNFQREAAHVLTKLFGDVCAVVRSEPQAKKLKETGLPELNEYVLGYICDKVVNSPSFQTYWPDSINRALGQKHGGQENLLMTTLLDTSEVRALLGLTPTLDEHDLMVRSLWEHIVEGDNYLWRHHKDMPRIQATKDLITAMPVSLKLIDIANKVKKRNLSDFLNLSKIKQVLHQPNAKLDGHLDWLAKLTQALLG